MATFLTLMLLIPGVVLATGGNGNDNGEADAQSKAEVFGVAGRKETAIGSGSVLGQATLRFSKCVVNSPITVGARVPSGTMGSVIVWGFDEDCRVTVREIRPGHRDSTGPAKGGHSKSPQPSADSPAHRSSNSGSLASSLETRTGWVSYYIGEQFEVPATQVYAEMGYED